MKAAHHKTADKAATKVSAKTRRQPAQSCPSCARGSPLSC